MPLREIEINADEVARDLQQFSDTMRRRILSRAINRSLTTMRKQVRNAIRTELNLKASDTNRALRIIRARANQTRGVLVVQAKAVPLVRYAARQTRRGVTVKVKRRGTRKLVEGAFVATMPSGHRGVFVRKRGAGRLPIRELFSTAPVQFLDDDQLIGQLERDARAVFARNLDREIRFRVGGL